VRTGSTNEKKSFEMPRKGAVGKREVLPDPKYHDRMVSKFINSMMADGKRSLAERIFYDALDLMTQRTKDDAVGLFRKGIENVKPVVEVRSRRVGGATYQVPSEVRPARRNSLAMRWIVQNARARGEKSMEERLAGELVDAANGRGAAVKKREDTHRMAEANKAFAHYRW
jgi:small subunit ribosomal protein S7